MWITFFFFITTWELQAITTRKLVLLQNIPGISNHIKSLSSNVDCICSITPSVLYDRCLAHLYTTINHSVTLYWCPTKLFKIKTYTNGKNYVDTMVETPTILKQDLLTSISQVAQNIPCCFRNALTGFFFFHFYH